MSKKSEEKYDKLISYFKYLVAVTSSAITIIVAVALYFTYNNMNELRNEVKENSKEYKETIKDFNSYAQKAIDKTQEQTQKEIELISKDAKQLALEAAKEKIDESFEKANIEKLIDEAADRKLKNEIDKIIRTKLDDANKYIDEQIDIIPELILNADKVRWGDQNAFNFLDSLNKNSNNPKIRKLTMDIMNGKAKDYENSLNDLVSGFKLKTPFDLLDKNERKEILNIDTTIMINNLIDRIDRSYDLHDAAESFYILKYLGIDIQMFDFDKIEMIKNNSRR